MILLCWLSAPAHAATLDTIIWNMQFRSKSRWAIHKFLAIWWLGKLYFSGDDNGKLVKYHPYKTTHPCTHSRLLIKRSLSSPHAKPRSRRIRPS